MLCVIVHFNAKADTGDGNNSIAQHENLDYK